MKHARYVNSAKLALMAVTVGLVMAASEAQAADTVSGKKIYDLQCAGCHGTTGEAQMPGMANFNQGEALFVADNQLVSTIEEGRNAMPAYRGLLSTYEILDVIAYIRTLH